VLLEWDARGCLSLVQPASPGPAGVPVAAGPLLPGLPNLHSQRFWLESEKRWVTLRVSGHGMRTIDKKGVEALLPPLWRHGQVRLPDLSSWKTQALVNEVTTWKPEKKRGTDLVMAEWFAELHWPKVGEAKLPKPQARPSWMNQPRELQYV
jgi:hypothetical protein